MVFIAGISLAVFFEILLISKKNKTEADLILALWMLLISFHLFEFYMFHTGAIYQYPFLLGIEMPFPLFHGVFLYLYVGSVTNQLPPNRYKLILHFIPASLAYLYLIDFISRPSEYKIEVYSRQGAGYEIFLGILNVAVIISGIFYVLWSLFLLRKHRRRILDQFSDIEKINLLWLRILTWGMGGIWIISFKTGFFQSFRPLIRPKNHAAKGRSL